MSLVCKLLYKCVRINEHFYFQILKMKSDRKIQTEVWFLLVFGNTGYEEVKSSFFQVFLCWFSLIENLSVNRYTALWRLGATRFLVLEFLRSRASSRINLKYKTNFNIYFHFRRWLFFWKSYHLCHSCKLYEYFGWNLFEKNENFILFKRRFINI